MPIYEFYCADCHMIYNFFARTADTKKRPSCPKCGRPKLERRMSRFAISRGRAGSKKDDGEGGGPDADDPLANVDEARLERALSEMAREAEHMDEDDPRQMAHMMRKLYQATGMEMGPGMQEAMRRLEAGEDPDKIEEELGDVLEEEDPLLGAGEGEEGEDGGGKKPGGRLKAVSRRIRPPGVDETLYDL